MVGIGVGIDYALLIVTRFRGSLAEGQDPRSGDADRDRDRRAAPSSFAGLTVVVSMLGILLMGQPSMTGFAFTVVLAVLIVMAASVTLLPALLGFAGRNIERLHVPFVSKRRRRRTTPRAGTAGAGSSSAGPGSPRSVASPCCWHWPRRSWASASASPTRRTTRPASPPGRPTTCSPTASARASPRRCCSPSRASPGPRCVASADAVGDQLREVDGVAFVDPAVVNDAGDTAVLQARRHDLAAGRGHRGPGRHAARRRHSRRHVRHRSHRGRRRAGGRRTSTRPAASSERLPLLLRRRAADVVPAADDGLPVGRRPAQGRGDEPAGERRRLRGAGLAVSGGRLGDLVGIPEATPVPDPAARSGSSPSSSGSRWTTRSSCCRGSRRSTTGPATTRCAVADGLAKSARVITAGAAVMVTVFLSFVLGDDVLGKMFGIGLAAAILIDATVVRMVLVPATMELLGDRNWWLPAWLDRLLPRIDVEGGGSGAVREPVTAGAEVRPPGRRTGPGRRRARRACRARPLGRGRGRRSGRRRERSRAGARR